MLSLRVQKCLASSPGAWWWSSPTSIQTLTRKERLQTRLSSAGQWSPLCISSWFNRLTCRWAPSSCSGILCWRLSPGRPLPKGLRWSPRGPKLEPIPLVNPLLSLQATPRVRTIAVMRKLVHSTRNSPPPEAALVKASTLPGG